MHDFFADLPAPLPLYILLELTDIKALYAALLASPDLYAVFQLNAPSIFEKIAERSCTAELVRPIMTYMHMLENRFRGVHTIDWTELATTASSMHLTGFTCKSTPNPVIFHMVAQAVRIHDVAYSIIRSKLDYLSTCEFQKLADPQQRYRRPFQAHLYDFRGVPLHIPRRLRDPSWMEESRVIQILWVLCVSWRMAQTSIAASGGLPEIRERFLNLFGMDGPWTRLLPDEIVECLLRGPTMRSPDERDMTRANETSLDALITLQTYRIQHPVHSLQDYKPHLQSMSPNFRCSPAICPPSSAECRAWGLDRICLSWFNTENRWLRVMRTRMNSPLQDSSSEVFECLGLSIWDDQRLMTELRFRPVPRAYRSSVQTGGEISNHDSGNVEESDQMFRLLEIYEYQKMREQEGWHR